jgi:hypothetical protein
MGLTEKKPPRSLGLDGISTILHKTPTPNQYFAPPEGVRLKNDESVAHNNYNFLIIS